MHDRDRPETGPAPRVAAPARDGDIAIREEFAAAVIAFTPEALELFIRRNPDHLLAGYARDMLARIANGRQEPRHD